MKYLNKTNSLANGLPFYMRGRHDKFSVYQQAINAIALQTDDLDKDLERHHDNRFPQTFRHDTMDVIYTTPYHEDLTNISGDYGTMTRAETNDPREWWYHSVPTGISKIDTIAPQVLYYESPLAKEISELEANELNKYPSILYVILRENDSSVNFIDTTPSQPLRPTVIIIYGEDIYGEIVQEELSFYLAGKQRTNTIFRKVNRIECEYYDDPDKFILHIASAPISELSMDSYHRENYQVIQDKYGIEKFSFWDFEGRELIFKQYAADHILQYHGGIKDINDVARFTLQNINGVIIDNIPTCILPSENDDLIYVYDGTYLHGYDKNIDYPSVVNKATTLKTPDAVLSLDIKIDPGTFTAKAYYTHLAMGKKISQFRFILTKGSEEYLYDVETETWISYDPNTWINNSNASLLGFQSPEVTYGDGTLFNEDMILRIEAKIHNGTIETDTFVITKQCKKAMFSLTVPAGIAGLGHILCYANDGLLAFADNSSINRIKFQNNSYIVNEERDLILFAEYNSEIEISIPVGPFNDTQILTVEPTPFNVFNELDQWGVLLAVKRKLGESNIDYIRRLREASFRPPGSSIRNLTYAISRDFQLPVKDTLYIDNTSKYDFQIKNGILSETTKITFEVSGQGQSQTVLSVKSLNLFETETIEDVMTWLNSQSYYNMEINTSVINEQYLQLPARCLCNTTNVIYIKNQIFEKSTLINLPIPDDCAIDVDSIVIEGFQSPGDMETDLPYYLIASDGTAIETSQPLSINNPISFKVRKNNMIIQASPIAIIDMHGIESNLFSGNTPSERAGDILNELSIIHPNKWSN
jgi:hypothetical protein